MSFSKLHPTLQYHIVNSIGWSSLRPIQEACIDPVLSNKSLVILAQTAGGKTEASFFPLMSRILTENWKPLSTLYICPLKALLNNQEQRLRKYFEMIGHRAEVWHGDITPSAKKKIIQEPPSCLLTTPESLEAILVSKRTNNLAMFANIKSVVIDEAHAFAGDDRGWHLLSLLRRISEIANRSIQRIGLSATVGNPEDMAEWLSVGHEDGYEVIKPTTKSTLSPDVKLDYVGSLSNAATVINRLFRGEKRLVFTDSRSRSEELGGMLNKLGTKTFVIHSSLSKDLRTQTERAFAEESNCVIVATSALELGIDIGDLDRVIQIDCPSTVSSFLQRMGRTGRRQDTVPNCLFLATSEEMLLQSAGLIKLWSDKYIEPIIPPAKPYHVLAQQLLAITLQNSGIDQSTALKCINDVSGLGDISSIDVENILIHMKNKDILVESDGILWFGEVGEKLYGKRNFMDTLSIFTSPPLMTVMNGTKEVATIDELVFRIDNSQSNNKEQANCLTLGGKYWQVTNIDWKKRIVYVTPSDIKGRTRWMGAEKDLSYKLTQAQKDILTSDKQSPMWSVRAIDALEKLRDENSWISNSQKYSFRSGSRGAFELWTYAGTKFNRILSQILESHFDKVKFDEFYLEWYSDITYEDCLPIIEQGMDDIQNGNYNYIPPEELSDFLKFNDCIPVELITQLWRKRLSPLNKRNLFGL